MCWNERAPRALPPRRRRRPPERDDRADEDERNGRCEQATSPDAEGFHLRLNPAQVLLKSAMLTAKARDLILARSATADRGVRPSFLMCPVGHLDRAGVTQLCWHRKTRPSCTPTVVAGSANAPAIKTNQANTLRTRLIWSLNACDFSRHHSAAECAVAA